jgi:hypothetical protein
MILCLDNVRNPENPSSLLMVNEHGMSIVYWILNTTAAAIHSS